MLQILQYLLYSHLERRFDISCSHLYEGDIRRAILLMQDLLHINQIQENSVEASKAKWGKMEGGCKHQLWGMC